MDWLECQMLNEEDSAARALAWEDGQGLCSESLPLLQQVYRRDGDSSIERWHLNTSCSHIDEVSSLLLIMGADRM